MKHTRQSPVFTAPQNQFRKDRNMSSRPPTSCMPAMPETDRVGLRDRVMLTSIGVETRAVLAQLEMLSTRDLRIILMNGPPALWAIHSLKMWPAIISAEAAPAYIKILRRLKLSAAEVLQTNMLQAVQSLADITAGQEESTVTPLLRDWQDLVQRLHRTDTDSLLEVHQEAMPAMQQPGPDNVQGQPGVASVPAGLGANRAQAVLHQTSPDRSHHEAGAPADHLLVSEQRDGLSLELAGASTKGILDGNSSRGVPTEVPDDAPLLQNELELGTNPLTVGSHKRPADMLAPLEDHASLSRELISRELPSAASRLEPMVGSKAGHQSPEGRDGRKRAMQAGAGEQKRSKKVAGITEAMQEPGYMGPLTRSRKAAHQRLPLKGGSDGDATPASVALEQDPMLLPHQATVPAPQRQQAGELVICGNNNASQRAHMISACPVSSTEVQVSSMTSAPVQETTQPAIPAVPEPAITATTRVQDIPPQTGLGQIATQQLLPQNRTSSQTSARPFRRAAHQYSPPAQTLP
ncbi:hypothetical protein ABBQ38_008129 [Trebouxia sp. C0009 RCD-2024]